MTMMRFLIANLAPEGSPLQRLSTTGRFMTGGSARSWRRSRRTARRLRRSPTDWGFAEAVRRSLPQALERWDGKGGPDGVDGERIDPVMRVVQVAKEAEVIARSAACRRRSGC